MTNCLLVALVLYWRRWRRGRRRGKQHGDYLVIRLSRIPWGVFHVMHGKLDRTTGQIKVVSYKPDAPAKTRFAPFFKGRIRRGDRTTESPPNKR